MAQTNGYRKDKLVRLNLPEDCIAALFDRERYLDDIVALKALQLLRSKYPTVGGLHSVLLA